MIQKLINDIQDKLQGKVPRGTKRSDKWPEIRNAFIKSHPECACCGSKNKLQAHHKMPFHLHPDRELDVTNLITLCEDGTHNCHILFGHLRNFKSYNPNVEQDVATWVDKVKTRPKDGSVL